MFSKPNYTQTPNEFFDEVAKTLKEGELRVMLVIMRQTFGWGNKQWDRISISQLMEKTGMKRDAVVRSTKSLVEKKLVTKHKEGKKGNEECWYSLVVEEPTEFSNPIDDSNNSYQSSKKTPPSLFKRPTKETPTKEINTNVNVPKKVERNVCINESLKRIGGLDDKAKEYASRFASEHEIQDALEACRYQEKKKKILNPSSFFVGTLKNKMAKRTSI
jgi:phage replication O-like protein O